MFGYTNPTYTSSGQSHSLRTPAYSPSTGRDSQSTTGAGGRQPGAAAWPVCAAGGNHGTASARSVPGFQGIPCALCLRRSLWLVYIAVCGSIDKKVNLWQTLSERRCRRCCCCVGLKGVHCVSMTPPRSLSPLISFYAALSHYASPQA